MSDESDHEFFRLRQQGKTYISKVFNFGAHNPEEIRNVWMVLGSGPIDVMRSI